MTGVETLHVKRTVTNELSINAGFMIKDEDGDIMPIEKEWITEKQLDEILDVINNAVKYGIQLVKGDTIQTSAGLNEIYERSFEIDGDKLLMTFWIKE
jgi:hypothetical protein